MNTVYKIFQPAKFLTLLWTTLQLCLGELNTCFDCAGKTDPFSCDVVRQCAPDQKCFSTSYFELNNPVQMWDFGCKDVSFCGLIIQDYSNMTKSKRQGEPSFRRRLTSCNDCCKGDYCNRVPCDEDSQKIMPKGLVCHTCEGVQDPAMCTKTKRCAVGQVCAVWTLDNGLVSLGCKDKTVCDSEGNNLLFGRRDIELDELGAESESIAYFEESEKELNWYTSGSGNVATRLARQQQQGSVSASGCRQCCLEHLCAASYCSKTNTLPPNAVTVTLPTTTLRPLFVKVVPVLVSTFEGDKAVFDCDVNGAPPLTVEYSRGFDSNKTSVRIPSCDTVSSTSVINRTCEFTNAQLSDTGNVSCTVTDALGQTHTSYARLVVEPYRDNFQAILSPKDSDLFPGVNTTIACSVRGYPLPSYGWYKNDSGSLVPVGKSSEFVISNTGDGSFLEVLANENSNIDGSYVCESSNGFEKLDLPFRLSVITKVSAIKTLSKQVIDGSKKDHTFSCSFKSYPPSFVSWILTTSANKMFTLSKNSSISSVVQDRTTSSDVVVTINDLVNNDIKYIKCMGNNSYFSNYSETEINILTPPHITTPPKTYRLTYGQALRLECQADGQPMPYVSWSFVDTFDNPQILQGADLKDDGKVLEVAHVRSNGKFTCYASNSIGTDSASFPVTII